MNNYRLTLIVRESLEEKERKALFDDVVKSFGELKKEDSWGVRPFSYEIQHQSKGFYMHYEFSSDPSSILALDKKLRLNEDILRFLLMKHEPRSIKKSQTVKKAERTEATTEKTK